MDEFFADEAALREMLERAVADEPPIGPVVHEALRGGLRRRRHRRVSGMVAGLAVVAAVSVTVPSVTVPSVTGTRGTVAAPATIRGTTVYVTSVGAVRNVVTTIDASTNRAGRPIEAGQFPSFMAVTPDGKTIYVVSSHPTGTVTPVSVATGKPDRRSRSDQGPSTSRSPRTARPPT